MHTFYPALTYPTYDPSVEEIETIATSVSTASGSAVGSSMATSGPAGDPVSLIYIVRVRHKHGFVLYN